MNSLVERLRLRGSQLMVEAADEIDRLEADKAEISKAASDLLHENERLQAEVVRVAALGVPGF
jgi:hypothetical protein